MLKPDIVLLLVKCRCCNASLILFAQLHEGVRLLVLRNCFTATKSWRCLRR